MIKVFTAFSGYDSQCMALDRLGIAYDLVGWSEIDNYAIQAHNAVYPQWAERNFGDISKIDWDSVPDFDLFTMSSPCTDFSNAGKQLGGEEGSGTRSSLLWECRKAIIAKRPKYIVFENVKALVGKKFIKGFNKWQLELEDYGYTNYAKVLNAKDFGIPQNRERIFMVSIRNDVDKKYVFPNGFALKKSLKDVLENVVDNKYYLKDKGIPYVNKRIDAYCQINGKISSTLTAKGIQNWTGTFVSYPFNDKDDVCRTIKAQYSNNGAQNFMSNGSFGATGVIDIFDYKIAAMRGREIKEQRKNIQQLEPRKAGISNTITTVQKDNLLVEPKVLYKGKEVRNYGGLYLETSDNFYRGCLDGLSRCLKATQHDAGVCDNYRIRKLTERECFRLMGVSESDIDKIQQCGVSKTQQYKMAGNSIVVDCLYYIFKNIFVENNAKKQLTLF